jgi:hypothetical protein
VEVETMKINKKSIQIDILVLIPFLVFVYIYETRLLVFFFSQPISAYYAHIEFAFKLGETDALSSPHFLYQLLVIAAVNLFYPNNGKPNLADYLAAGQLVSTGVCIVLFILLYLLFRHVLKRIGFHYSFFSALAALTLMVASAINVLVFVDRHSYFGYLPLNVLNGPTLTLLKVFTLPLFFLADAIFSVAHSSNKWLVPGAALLSVLSALAKPSFTVILLPAVGLLVGYKLLRKEYINWMLLLFGIILPSIIVLGWQYYVSYVSQWGELSRDDKFGATRIGFYPFGQFIAWKVPLFLLLPKMILSILFPLVVYVAYWKRAIKNFRFNFAWLIFLFGCLSTYFFVEIYIGSGQISRAGNFTWSGLIGVFIIFVAAGLFFVKQILEHPPGEKIAWLRLGASITALVLHVVFGLLWYFNQFLLFSKSFRY